jgi:hypothetical protein
MSGPGEQPRLPPSRRARLASLAFAVSLGANLGFVMHDVLDVMIWESVAVPAMVVAVMVYRLLTTPSRYADR